MDTEFIQRRLPMRSHSGGERKKAVGRINKICNAIESRFPEVTQPTKLRRKHIEWYIRVHFPEKSFRTQYDYQLTISYMLQALGKQHWENSLFKPKDPVKGGRPRLPNVARKTRRKFL